MHTIRIQTIDKIMAKLIIQKGKSSTSISYTLCRKCSDNNNSLGE